MDEAVPDNLRKLNPCGGYEDVVEEDPSLEEENRHTHIYGTHDNTQTNPVYPRSVNSLLLVCSLSSHRHSYILFVFGSRFIDS